MGVGSACPTTAYAKENRNIIEELFLDRHRLNATPAATRHDLVFATPHPTMRDSHNSISKFPAHKTTQIAVITRFFDFAWSGP
jgi:hypothetical protein